MIKTRWFTSVGITVLGIFVLGGCGVSTIRQNKVTYPIMITSQMVPQIPLIGAVIKTEITEFATGAYKGQNTTITLENKITIQNLDYGPDGKVDGRIVRQEFSDGRSIQELYQGYPGTITDRMTLMKPDASVVVVVFVFEKLCSDGLIEKRQHTLRLGDSLKIKTISKTRCSSDN